MKLKAPRITQDKLVEHCHEIGLSSGDTIMVHASLRSIGEILGGPDVLIAALRQAIGSEGTVMVYIGCQSPYDDVGRGIYSPEDEAFILEHCPPFEPDRERASRDFGAFAEYFRTSPGVICSRNPGCRMAAAGSKAEWLVQDHAFNYGLGVGSPLEKLCTSGGKVVLIGSDLDNVTLLHYAEAVAPISEKKIVRIKVPLLQDKERRWLDVEEYNSSTGIRDWPDNFFATIVQKFLEREGISAGQIGQSKTYVLDAKKLVEFAVGIMVEVSKTTAGAVP